MFTNISEEQVTSNSDPEDGDSTSPPKTLAAIYKIECHTSFTANSKFAFSIFN